MRPGAVYAQTGGGFVSSSKKQYEGNQYGACRNDPKQRFESEMVFSQFLRSYELAKLPHNVTYADYTGTCK